MTEQEIKENIINDIESLILNMNNLFLIRKTKAVELRKTITDEEYWSPTLKTFDLVQEIQYLQDNVILHDIKRLEKLMEYYK